nr:MAG TPA: hypothetical protein [Caudoviricetes sp.]
MSFPLEDEPGGETQKEVGALMHTDSYRLK